MCKEEENEMATETIFKPFFLDEEAAKNIISSTRTKIKHTNVFNDIKLTDSERIANAKRILNSRKCK